MPARPSFRDACETALQFDAADWLRRECWGGRLLQVGLPNSLRNSAFAASRTRRLSSVRPEPARLMKKVNIDIAERKGELLRRLLYLAECFSERAISRGSSSAKTPASRSSALLSRVTFCDQ